MTQPSPQSSNLKVYVVNSDSGKSASYDQILCWLRELSCEVTIIGPDDVSVRSKKMETELLTHHHHHHHMPESTLDNSLFKNIINSSVSGNYVLIIYSNMNTVCTFTEFAQTLNDAINANDTATRTFDTFHMFRYKTDCLKDTDLVAVTGNPNIQISYNTTQHGIYAMLISPAGLDRLKGNTTLIHGGTFTVHHKDWSSTIASYLKSGDLVGECCIPMLFVPDITLASFTIDQFVLLDQCVGAPATPPTNWRLWFWVVLGISIALIIIAIVAMMYYMYRKNGYKTVQTAQ